MTARGRDHLTLAVSVTIVIVLTIATWSPALSCFYFSEDLIHCYMAAQALGAHREVLLQYLTAPFFQCSNMGLFYRPAIELSFVTDTLLYGRNVAGFHLTNILSHTAAALLCLLLTRKLVLLHASDAANGARTKQNATAAGLVAGLLFGLNPLQGETIYWIICRCDCFCTMFSLASLYLAVLARDYSDGRTDKTRAWSAVLSMVAFTLALLAKEQAFMVPFLLFLYYVMFPQTKDRPLRRITPYVLLLLLMLALRLVLLGNIGGYHGTIGYMLNGTPLLRFLSPVAWNKLFYPLDQNAFLSMPWFPLVYSFLYLLMGAGAFFAWRDNSFSAAKFKLIGYFTACAAIVLLPVVQSFVILESLYGARYAYMFQAFIAMALAVLLLGLRPKVLRNLIVPVYLLVLLYTNIADNHVWTARSQTMRSLQTAINNWALSAPPQQKICLLNMPLDEKEYSSLYDLEQMRTLLRPLANDRDISERVVSTSYFRMIADCNDEARLKAFAAAGNVDFVISSLALGQPFKLTGSAEMQKRFAPINQSVSFCTIPQVSSNQSNASVQAVEVSLKETTVPQRTDYIEVLVAPTQAAAESKSSAARATGRAQPVFLCPSENRFFALWISDLTVIYPDINWSTAAFDRSRRRYIFPVGDRLSWKCADRIDHLILGNLPADWKVQSVSLHDQSDLVPLLSGSSEGAPLASDDPQADGMIAINESQSASVNWDATKVAGADRVMLEISLPDFLYAPYAGGFREFELGKHNLKTIEGQALTGSLHLKRKDFPQPAKYQMRVAACDSGGQVVGYCSDPVEFVVTDRPFADPFARALFNLRAQRQK
ncbi:MAG: hypothetical protein JST01_14735 [Cyanobacteria bacterium SZAS TMP-1]|nr:hypothetical protein [Cyanobacteria bacterium SZAS TMP-1]